MPRRVSLALSGLLAALVVGCTLLSPPDPRLCSAAQSLSAAVSLAATAIEADGAGDFARAQGLATQSRSLAELANGVLHQVPDEQHSQPVWQSLLVAYGQVGQASNALLPAFGHEPEMARETLAAARAAMTQAGADLPSMCFALPGDIETPGST